MKNLYATFMEQFFHTVDPSLEQDSEGLARAFAEYYWATEKSLDDATCYRCLGSKPGYGDKIALPSTVSDLQNISIVAEDTPLEFLTKRVPLVADVSVFSHFNEEAHQFFFKDHGQSFRVDSEKTTGYIRCPDLGELGTWLRQCKPLLIRGELFYLPDVSIKHHLFTMYSGQPQQSDRSQNPLFDFLVSNKKIVQHGERPQGIPEIVDNKTKAMLLRPILTIDLPFIENVDVETFAKISADESDSLQSFRDFLKRQFLELKDNEESEFFDANLQKIAIDLRDGVRSLNSDFRMLRRKRVFQTIGASIAAFTAMLVAVNSAAFGMLPALLGTGGGLLSLTNVMEQHMTDKEKISTNKFYYLWLLSQRTNRFS